MIFRDTSRGLFQCPRSMPSLFFKISYQQLRPVRLYHRHSLFKVLVIYLGRVIGYVGRVIVVALAAAKGCPDGVHLDFRALVQNRAAYLVEEAVIVALPAHLVGQRHHSPLYVGIEEGLALRLLYRVYDPYHRCAP